MLRITIELVPGGEEAAAEVIGRGYIGNVTRLREMSDYTLKFEERPWQGMGRGPYTGVLTNWPRNDRGAWEIVHAALGIVISNGPLGQR